MLLATHGARARVTSPDCIPDGKLVRAVPDLISFWKVQCESCNLIDLTFHRDTSSV